jgi:hypothetical protein
MDLAMAWPIDQADARGSGSEEIDKKTRRKKCDQTP